MHQLAVGAGGGGRGGFYGNAAAIYPGLNSSSSAFDVQLHLHLNDASSRCASPRDALRQRGSGGGSGADDELVGGLSDAAFSLLLLLGVLLCALFNAWSLGYVTPNRHVRYAMRAIGCPQEQLVR